MSAALDAGPIEIWLSPICDEEAEGRLWAPNDIGDCEECGAKTTKYVRADVAELAERDAVHRFLDAVENSQQPISHGEQARDGG